MRIQKKKKTKNENRHVRSNETETRYKSIKTCYNMTLSQKTPTTS